MSYGLFLVWNENEKRTMAFYVIGKTLVWVCEWFFPPET